MKKHKRFVVLPQDLIQKLESINLTKKQLNQAKKLVNLIINKSSKDKLLMSEYVELPQNYLQKVFGKYHPWFTKLKDEEVIDVNHGYTIGRSKSYRINPIYLTPIWISDSFEETQEELLHICSTVLYKEQITNDLKELKVNKDKLLELTKKYVESIKATDFKTDEQINNDFFQITDRKYGVKRFTTLASAITIANERGMAVIKDKNNYYMDYLNNFIKEKKEAVQFHYQKAIEKLDKGIYFVHRNQTNNRLDSNITNLCELLVNQIMIDNNLCSIDLSNSQFAIFCYNYEQEDNPLTLDFLNFKQLAVNGKLYDEVKELLNLENRKEAKSLMFELFFSSHRYNPTKKKELKKYFPTVVAFIDKYKKEHGDNMFSIMLQQKEADIFIDNIYQRIKERGMFCLTKHDSVIVRQHHLSVVKKIIEEYFEEINFKGTLKLENTEPVWMLELMRNLEQMEYDDRIIYLANCCFEQRMVA